MITVKVPASYHDSTFALVNCHWNHHHFGISSFDPCRRYALKITRISTKKPVTCYFTLQIQIRF